MPEMASRTTTETVRPTVIHIVTAAETPEGREEATGAASTQKQVSWDEGTLDNENMGKKSSKVCCIYTKPRAFAESSSESSSSGSDSSSDSGGGEGAKKANRRRKARKSKDRAESHKLPHPLSPDKQPTTEDHKPNLDKE